MIEAKPINIPDNFLEGLQLLKSKELKGRSSISFLSPKEKAMAELAKIDERSSRLLLKR